MKVWKITLTGLLIFLLVACQGPSESPIDQSTEGERNIMDQQLIHAAAQKDEQKVLSLIDEGVNVNTTDEQGQTAVMAATHNDNPNMVKLLIKHGADINIRNHNQDNVLLYAGAEGFLEIVKLAIEAGADTRLTNRYGGIAIIPAAERGHVEVVEELLVHSDTDVNHINNLHWTALLEAVILGDGGTDHQQIVKLLLDHGADVTISDREGVTPLEHAKQRGFKEIEELLKKQAPNE